MGSPGMPGPVREMECRLALELVRDGVGELAVERATRPVVGEGARETRVVASYGWKREELMGSSVRRPEFGLRLTRGVA